MRPRVNWRKFWTRFAFMYAVTLTIMFLGGCAGVLATISGLLPALATAFEAAVSFVSALEGKTVPADLSAKVTQWGSNIAGFIANLQSIISAAAGQATAGVIAQIQAVLQQIQTSTASILSEFNVTDSATVSKFISLVNLGVALIATILGLIPVALKLVSRTDVPEAQLEAEATEAGNHVKNAHKSMQEAYKVIRDTPTANTDVNTALTTLPAGLP
ncbi:MAG: hypothetical protein WBA09_22445 [Candidatus Acidiferrum sp.]